MGRSRAHDKTILSVVRAGSNQIDIPIQKGQVSFVKISKTPRHIYTKGRSLVFLYWRVSAPMNKNSLSQAWRLFLGSCFPKWLLSHGRRYFRRCSTPLVATMCFPDYKCTGQGWPGFKKSCEKLFFCLWYLHICCSKRQEAWITSPFRTDHSGTFVSHSIKLAFGPVRLKIFP